MTRLVRISRKITGISEFLQEPKFPPSTFSIEAETLVLIVLLVYYLYDSLKYHFTQIPIPNTTLNPLIPEPNNTKNQR